MIVRRTGSAADLEDLATADRTGALQGRLAVLHGDALGVQDFDLLLVLDAIGLCHSGSSSGCDRSVTGIFVPHPLQVRAVVVHSDGRQRSVDAVRFWASISASTIRPSKPVSTQAASAASFVDPLMNSPLVRSAKTAQTTPARQPASDANTSSADASISKFMTRWRV